MPSNCFVGPEWIDRIAKALGIEKPVKRLTIELTVDSVATVRVEHYAEESEVGALLKELEELGPGSFRVIDETPENRARKELETFRDQRVLHFLFRRKDEKRYEKGIAAVAVADRLKIDLDECLASLRALEGMGVVEHDTMDNLWRYAD
jgi:hypothetical protein